MATIAENLQTLNETKTAIKTAIESKGQDMTDVPFTSYADKITSIEGVSKADIIKRIVDTRGSASYLFDRNANGSPETLTDEDLEEMLKEDTFENATSLNCAFRNQKEITSITIKNCGKASAAYVCSGCSSLKSFTIENSESVTNMGYAFENCSQLEEVNMNTENVGDWTATFANNNAMKVAPLLKTSKGGTFNMVFNYALMLEECTTWDTSNAHTFQYFFNACWNLKKASLDVRNGTNLDGIIGGCVKLEEFWLKNIKTSVQISNSSVLKQECIIYAIRELRDTGASKTLTMGATNLAKITGDNAVYVKVVEVTDEMRAEDDLIDEKLPFEICEPMDDGAMLITEYAQLKNWQIA